MTQSIAIWPSPSGKVRLAARSSDGTGTWRNGGTCGNSEKALQPDAEHDTLLLSTILTYFGGRYNAKPTQIGWDVLILKVKPRHLPKFLSELMQMLIADGVDSIRIPWRNPKTV